MTPQEMIDRYVYAVAQRLPQRQRADVSAELRDLLKEEFAAQPAQDQGAVKALLLRFGAPDEVAARYAPPALVVEQRDTRTFWQVNGIFALVIGALAFIGALASPDLAAGTKAADAFYLLLIERLLMLVGATTLIFFVIGALRRRTPSAQKWSPAGLPPVRDPDYVNRIGWTFAFLYFAIGAVVLAFPTITLAMFWGGEMPAPARDALTYDPAFLAARSRVLFVFIAASLALLAWVIVRGRWSRNARIAQIVMNVGFAGVMIWALRGGPIFVNDAADQTMKAGLALFAVICLIDAGMQARRIWGAGAQPAEPRARRRVSRS